MSDLFFPEAWSFSDGIGSTEYRYDPSSNATYPPIVIPRIRIIKGDEVFYIGTNDYDNSIASLGLSYPIRVETTVWVTVDLDTITNCKLATSQVNPWDIPLFRVLASGDIQPLHGSVITLGGKGSSQNPFAISAEKQPDGSYKVTAKGGLFIDQYGKKFELEEYSFEFLLPCRAVVSWEYDIATGASNVQLFLEAGDDTDFERLTVPLSDTTGQGTSQCLLGYVKYTPDLENAKVVQLVNTNLHAYFGMQVTNLGIQLGEFGDWNSTYQTT